MENYKTATELQQDVMDELNWEPSLDAANIGVSVDGGIVTLSGYVPSFAEKFAAERAAARVKGVRAVAEEIDVRLPGSNLRTDADIAKVVLDTLRWHTYLPEEKIKVKVEDGWVTLTGEVPWHYQRTSAVNAIRHLTGVKGVYNLLTVKPNVVIGEIKTKIRKALERVAAEDAGHITVDVKGTEVTLGGHVRTSMEQQEAADAAWAAPGVTSVKNETKIQPAIYA